MASLQRKMLSIAVGLSLLQTSRRRRNAGNPILNDNKNGETYFNY
jgi:hypothetical protein